jgi:hypothetical protein
LKKETAEDKRVGMARPLRFEGEGALCHVINRGNYRADIFQTKGAKEAFLACLGEACEKSGWVLHAWCVMSNQKEKLAALERGDLDLAAWREQMLQERLGELLRRAGRTAKDVAKDKRSAEWKVALATALKRESNATNRWLGQHLNMGSIHDVSRRVSAHQRRLTISKA